MRVASYSPAPDGCVIYAVGDIHGRVDLLQNLHRRVDRDREQHPNAKALEIYLGDYIDRGPSSASVIECLIKRQTDIGTAFLRGNHEAVFQALLDGEISFEAWRSVGGLETVLSYGVNLSGGRYRDKEYLGHAFAAAVPQQHRAFLSSLRNMLQIGPYLFVHAGVRPGVPLAEQKPEDLFWIRDEFLSFEGDHGFVVVHGHSPAEEPEFLPNRINLDTGAYITGRLTCLRIGPNAVSVLS